MKKGNKIVNERGMTLEKIYFFYKNDYVSIEDDNLGLIKNLIEIFEKATDGYINAIKSDGSPDFYLKQLDEWRNYGKSGLNRNMTLWMANIYILTKLGYIKNDDANGLLYNFERSEGDILEKDYSNAA